MKSLFRIILMLLVLTLALASCRSPFIGQKLSTVSLSLSIPSDLSSPIPSSILRRIGESELSGSRARFIHPDSRLVKVELKNAGAIVSSAEATITAGSRATELTINSVPLGLALTMNVSVYDAEAKIGENNVEIPPLSNAQAAEPITIGILPLDATPLELIDGEQTLLGLEDGKLHVYSLSLPGKGLYRAELLLGSDPPPTTMLELYTPDGLLHGGFAADPANEILYGLFGNDYSNEATYYMVVTGPAEPMPVGLALRLSKLPFDLVVFGETYYGVSGSSLLLPPSDSVNFGDQSTQPHKMTLSMYNAYQSMLTFKKAFLSGAEAEAFSLQSPPSQTLPPRAVIEFVLSYTDQLGGGNPQEPDFTIDVETLDNFTIALFGSGSI